jgi:hypothetical protein
VNRSAELIVEVPPGVVTTTSTAPERRAGACTVNVVSETTTRLVPSAVPKCTAVAPVSPVPSTSTETPVVGPWAGDTAVTVGTGS